MSQALYIVYTGADSRPEWRLSGKINDCIILRGMNDSMLRLLLLVKPIEDMTFLSLGVSCWLRTRLI